MTADDTGNLRRALAVLLARGDIRDHEREIGALVQRIHDATGANPSEILERACTDAANLLIGGGPS